MSLGGLFYPKGTKKKPIEFESLFIPYIYKEIYFDGVYVDIFNTKKDMVVVDVGANIGVVSDYMRKYCKKLYAIEPSTEHFEALKKNKEFNEWDNTEVFNIAIADIDGEMDLLLNEGNRTMHSLNHGKTAERVKSEWAVKSAPLAPYTSSEKVKTMAMDTFFKENNIEKCDFMKFDVEGAEDMILRSVGFKRVAEKISAIEVEFHYPNWQELVKYMMELGYKARRYESSAIIMLFSRG